MTVVQSMTAGTAVLAMASLWGCGPRRVATLPSEPEVIALLAERERGVTGRALVSNAAGSVSLVADRDSTFVMKDQPPRAAAPLSETDVQAIFGEALSALPLPPRLFTLHFLFESDKLTEESRSLVTTILEVVRERPVPEVVVVGHTDTTGAADSNFKLGQRRAVTAQNLLVAAGLEPSLIEVMSLGEADLLIATPDETFEPRNRRVEIAIR